MPDPCHGERKWLSAVATCEKASTLPADAVTDLRGVVALQDIKLSAWVVRLPSDNREGGAAMLRTAAPTLDSVWKLCRDTLQGSALDLYSDSNARQRSIDCVADDVTAMRGQYATSAELALQRFHIEQLLGSGPSSRVDWAILPIMAVHDWTMHSGDISLAAATFDRLLNAHACLSNIDVNGDGLVNTTDKAFQPLVDWPLGMQDRHVMSNRSTIGAAFVLHGARHLAKLARLFGGTARQLQAASLDPTADAIAAAMVALQWNGSAFCDGICNDTPHTAFHS